jgi:ligand-binding SRPBCC domain-containing protein
MYTLYREQVLNTTLEKAWDFIKTPSNLNEITPDDLKFEIVTELPDEMYNGLLIEYRVNLPLLGKRPWVSEIKHIRPLASFVDEQRVGPYKMWYHYHGLEEVDGGVKMIDKIGYDIPFGPFGKIAHALFVKKQLQQIFEYRRQKLESVFHSSTG